MENYLNNIIYDDCIHHLPHLPDNSIHCLLSDIPYGIGLDDWDVLHKNTNSAYLGQSPAQLGKSGFKRRGKPINGWNAADKKITKEYQDWCYTWASLLFPKMKQGASVLVFGARRTIHRAITALEDTGFLLKDLLVWEKPTAHHRAQRLSGVLENRGLYEEAKKWEGWRLGNMAPAWEPVAWLFKPYEYTITDNVLANELGAINISESLIDGKSPTNILRFGFGKDEERYHEAQKPVELLEYLIRLVTRPGQIIIDPFMGSGSTAVACKRMGRSFIGFELNHAYQHVIEDRLNATIPLCSISQPLEHLAQDTNLSTDIQPEQQSLEW